MDLPEFLELESPIIEEVLEESQEAEVRDNVLVFACLINM